MEFKIVSFVLGEEEFGVDIMKIDSIVELGKLTKVPESADYVEGIMNFRGMVIPIVNLRKKFFMEDLPPEKKAKSKVIVVNLDKKKVGFMVDDVREVLTVSEDQMEEPPEEVGGVGNSYILGIAKIGDSMMIILDIEKVLSAEEQLELGKIVENV